MFPSVVVEESPPADFALAELTVEGLGRRLVRGVAEMAAFQAAWFEVLAEFDRRRGWEADGARSLSQWLSWRCGLDGRTAREHVRVMGRLAELPGVRAVFGEGRLSYSKVRAICRVATVDNEALLVELAAGQTATQLERTVAAFERTAKAPVTLGDDADRRERCGVRTWYDDEGLHHTEIVSAPEDGALIEAALRRGRDARYAESGRVDLGGAGRLDALVWVLRRGLVNIERPGVVDDSPYTIVVHVREAQAMVSDDGRVDLGDGVLLHPRTVQRLGCEGLVQAMVEGVDGRPLDVGRASRTATRKQRRALRSMYDHCEFPGCDVDVMFCEFHHLDWWSEGGRSDLHVFRPLCRRHHHLCHEGGWRLIVRDDAVGGLVAIPPGGDVFVDNAPALTVEPMTASALAAANRAAGGDPADDAVQSIAGRWGGEPMTRWALGAILDNLAATAAASGPGPAGTRIDARFRGVDPPSLN